LANIKGQTETVKKRRKSKFKIKPSLIAIYASVFILVVVIIFVGYQRPTNDAVVANAIDTANNSPSVDDVVATKIAAVVAEGIDLSIAPNVSSLAISTEAKIQFDQVNNVSSSKPQIVGVVASNRLVSKYTVLAGDTVDTIAAQFKISKDTLKWANNMIYDNLTVGKELKILPIDGVLYDVKAGDTVESIATKYKVDQNRLVIYNDLDVSGLQPNTQIILPSADLPANERPGYVAPVVYSYAGTGTGMGGQSWNIGRGTGPCPSYGYGQCVCYAYSRRIELGLPVGTNWGNASSWAYNARNAGLTVDKTPTYGSIIQNGGGWYGHVGIVEDILPNGDLKISEMNAYVYGGGWNIVNGRIIPAGNVGLFLYIH